MQKNKTDVERSKETHKLTQIESQRNKDKGIQRERERERNRVSSICFLLLFFSALTFKCPTLQSKAKNGPSKKRGQCDQIGRFIAFWATFQSLRQQLF